MESKPKILIVDDEETLCEALSFNLDLEGFETRIALSAEEALTFDLACFDLILLDIMMGDVSGTQFARILMKRPDTANIPIIFCTARDAESEMIDGLELGADDYITKPYSVRNVIARVRAVLRRTGAQLRTKAENMLRYEGLEVHLQNKVVAIDGQEVKMPRKEFEILALLMAHPGRLYSRVEILSEVWPEEVVVVDRVVDVNITRLRSKLGLYGSNIVTKPGYGYVFRN